MKLNEQIKAKRKLCGYSQEQLADMMGVSRQTVYKWESGTTLPTTENVESLSKLLNYDFSPEYNASISVKLPVTGETAASAEQTAKRPSKKFLVAGIVTGVIWLILSFVTYCMGMMVFSNTEGYMRVSTSSIGKSEFYIFLVLSVASLALTVFFIVKHALSRSKNKKSEVEALERSSVER